MIPKLRFSLRTCLVACFTVSLLSSPLVEASGKSRRAGKSKNAPKQAAGPKEPVLPTAPASPSPIPATKPTASNQPANDAESEHDAFFREKIQKIIDTRSFVPRFLSVIVSKFDKHPMCKIDEIGDECTVYSALNNLHLSIGSAILSYVVKQYEVPNADFIKILDNNNDEYRQAFQEFKSNELDKAVDKLFDDLLAFYAKQTETTATAETPETANPPIPDSDLEVAEIVNIRDNFGNAIKEMLHEWADKVVGPKFVYSFYPANFIDKEATKIFSGLNGNSALQQFFADYTNTFLSFFKTFNANSKSSFAFALALLDSFEPLKTFHFKEVELLRRILCIDDSEFKAGFAAAIEVSNGRPLAKLRQNLLDKAKAAPSPAPVKSQPETPVTNGVKTEELTNNTVKTEEVKKVVQEKATTPALVTESTISPVVKEALKVEEKTEEPAKEEPKEQPSTAETSSSRPPTKRQNQRRPRKTETAPEDKAAEEKPSAVEDQSTVQVSPAIDPVVEKVKKEEEEKKLQEIQRLKEEEEKKAQEEKRLKEEEEKLQEIQRLKAEEERRIQEEKRLKEEERKALEKKRKEEELLRLEKERNCLAALKVLENNAVFSNQGLGTLNFKDVAIAEAFKIVKECKNLTFAIERPANRSSNDHITKFRTLLEEAWRPTFKAGFEIKVGLGALVNLRMNVLKTLKDISKTDAGKLSIARLQSLVIFSNPKREEFMNLTVATTENDRRLFIENGTLNLPYGSKNITLEQVTILVRNAFEPTPIPQPPSLSPASQQSVNNGKNTPRNQPFANSVPQQSANNGKNAQKNGKAAPANKAAPVPEMNNNNNMSTPTSVVSEKPKVKIINNSKKPIEEKKEVSEKPKSEPEVEPLPEKVEEKRVEPVPEVKRNVVETVPEVKQKLEPVVEVKSEPILIPMPKVISVVELSMRDTLLPMETPQRVQTFSNKANFETTSKVFVRLAVLEMLNRVISENFAGEILLDVYGSTRSLCALPVSDMDVIVLHRNSGMGGALLTNIHKLLREYNEDEREFQLLNLEEAVIRRFNSFIGANRITDEIEQIFGSFKILEVREQLGFGMLTLILECTSNYTAQNPVILEMDLNLHEHPIPGQTSLSHVASLPLKQQAQYYTSHRSGEGVPKISGLFGLTNIFEQIEAVKCSPQTFLNLVRIVKSWSVTRRIYSSLAGYMSSTSIMVTCAKAVQEQYRLGQAMTLDALVLTYFDYMSKSFATSTDFINVVPLTPGELHELRTHHRNKYCSLFPCIVNPVYVIPGSSVVNSKMSISTHRMILIEVRRALSLLNSGTDLRYLYTPLSKKEQANSMLENLNRTLVSRSRRSHNNSEPFSMCSFEVTLPKGINQSAEAEQAMWGKLESQLFLFAKNGDGTEDFTKHMRQHAFLLVDITDVVREENKRPKYVFYLFTKSMHKKREFAYAVASTNYRRFNQYSSLPILSTSDKEILGRFLEEACSLVSSETSSSTSSTPSPYTPPMQFNPSASPSPIYHNGPHPNWPPVYPGYAYDQYGQLVQLPPYGQYEGYQPFN